MAPLQLTRILLEKRVTMSDMGKRAPALLDVWIYFNLIINTICLPILIATFLFSKRAKRHPTLVNLCLTWVFSGIFSLLLFYAKQHVGHEPDRALCITQSTLIYGIIPMWAVAVLMMMYYILVSLNADPGKPSLGTKKLVFVLSAPYIAMCAFSLASLFISLNHPEKVNRHHRFFYCAVKFDPLSNAMSLFVFLIGLGILYIEVRLGQIVYRIWRGMRKAGRASGIDLQLLMRVFVFGAYIIFGMVTNVISVFDSHSVAPDMYFATVGAVVFLVFSSQPDVIRVWCFWLRDPPPPRPKTIHLPSEPIYDMTIDLTKSAPASEGEKHFILPAIPANAYKR